MSENSERFKEIVSNVLIADPITVKGKGALTALKFRITENDYLTKIYVPPFTIYDHLTSETHNSEVDPDFEAGYTKTVEINALKSAKAGFERRLKTLDDSLFVIKGGAGTGKTIYVHHLQKEFPYIHFCFCDFEGANKAISLFGIPYDFGKKYSNNVWKFISIISEKVSRVLFDKHREYGFVKHRDYIERITEIYGKYFNILHGEITVVDETAMRGFFDILKFYSNGKIEYEELQSKLQNYIMDKYDMFEKNCEHKEAVTYICGILIRLFFCLNNIMKENNKSEKYVCVIDNIEYVVPFDDIHPIQECELQTIMSGVAESTSLIRPIITKWKRLFNDYDTFFGYLLVTRDTSVSLAGYRQYDDFNQESEIDITTWFCLEDIYGAKADYFSAIMKELEKNPYYTAYQNIINDMSQYNWGMFDMVCKMYCYNNRRIGFDIVNAIAYQPESDITYFNKMWSKCISNPELLAVKHMCRKFVFRIILNYIQQTHYFDALMVENQRATAKAEKKIESDFNSKTSYARKIANTLYRKDIEERIGGTREYVTFPEIIRSVLKPPYLSNVPTDQHIEDLAAIMYLMNETRNEMTNWAPLIMIKFDNEQVYNKETLIKELKKQWRLYKEKGGKEKYKNYFNKYGVHITTSGAFFAKMVPDFEYFACRFADKYPALMVRENFKKVGEDSYQCIELINVVKENAFWCVDEVIDRDKKFFGSTGRSPKLQQRFKPLYDPNSPYKWIYVSDPKNGTAIPHPMRILNHQRGYLLHYVEYLKAVDKEDLSEEARDKITEKVQKCIVSYTNKISSIKKENPDYFL